MIAFRDETARRHGLKLIVYINEEGVARGISPIASGSSLHTQVMKTEALKQALDQYGFDAAFGGARRDEERAAPRSDFSFRCQEPRLGSAQPAARALESVQHARQRRAKHPRLPAVQLDRTRYLAIHPLEKIPVVPLYFAEERPVVRRAAH